MITFNGCDISKVTESLFYQHMHQILMSILPFASLFILRRLFSLYFSCRIRYPLLDDLHFITIWYRLCVSLLCLTTVEWHLNMQSSRESLVGTEDTEGKKDSKGEKGRNTVSLSHGEAFFRHRSWIMTSPSSFHHLITAINFRLIIIIPFAERETLLDKYSPVKDDAIYYPVVQGSRFLFCYIS